jgi:hypothetical protein
VRGLDLIDARFAFGLLLSLDSFIMRQSVVVSVAKEKLERNEDIKIKIKRCFMFYPLRIDIEYY